MEPPTKKPRRSRNEWLELLQTTELNEDTKNAVATILSSYPHDARILTVHNISFLLERAITDPTARDVTAVLLHQGIHPESQTPASAARREHRHALGLILLGWWKLTCLFRRLPR